MDRNLLKSLYIILLSFGLALIFNFLFFGKEVGISVSIFTVLLLGAVFLLSKYQKLSMQKSWWLIAPILFFALMPAIRANEFLTFLNVCATLGLLMLLAYEINGTPSFLMKIRDYIILLLVVPFRMLRRAISTLSVLGKIHSSVKNREVWIRIIKGFIMALPLLIIFSLLFTKADLAFSQFFNNIFDINISERSAQYVALLGFAFISGLSFLSYIFFPVELKKADTVKTDEIMLVNKGIEVMVFLGLISTLFLVFIVFQITYLFGGESNIVNAGFTYAEYARHGFWELLTVSILSLLVLIASEKYSGHNLKRDTQFMIPALVLIAEVFVIIVSAFKRLYLYIDAYGMTLLRFYVAGFIILLLVLFVILAVKFIKSKQEQFFAFGTLLSVIVFLIVVNAINPDAFIINSNIKQFNRTGKVDAMHAGSLSSDAEAGKIKLYNNLTGQDKTILGNYLIDQKNSLQMKNSHWQSANISRNQGLKLLKDF